MSNKYTTQAGTTITETNEGDLTLETDGFTIHMDEPLWGALQEYFRYKQDEGYERWRDPENPDMVAYPVKKEEVRVVNETNGKIADWGRWEIELLGDTPCIGPFEATAKRYFEAHPKPDPKPWQDAQLGEIWALTLNDGDPVAAMVQNSNIFDTHLLFAWEEDGCYLDEETITSGRRIWPEPEGETK